MADRVKTFRLPASLDKLLREAGFAASLTVRRQDSLELDSRDSLEVGALLAGYEAQHTDTAEAPEGEVAQ